MENPKEEKLYTTIFADGSVILQNYWMQFPDGTGKWYWNEEIRGGVVAWTEIPEGGYKTHKWYRLPDWELRDLIIEAEQFHAFEKFNGLDDRILNAYLIDKGFASFESIADEELRSYYNGYECK